MISNSSDHYVFTWTYKTYKSIISLDTYDRIMTTQHILWFWRLDQEFDNLFDYTFQEVANIKLPNITIIQIKYGISIDQTYHIIKSIIQ